VSNFLPQTAEHNRCWCLEWTLIRGCAYDDDDGVEQDSKCSEGGEDACNGGIDGPHVSAESTSKEEESDLEHDWKALNEEVERPLLESIEFALAVSATLNH
jgi:hypothetical protein